MKGILVEPASLVLLDTPGCLVACLVVAHVVETGQWVLLVVLVGLVVYLELSQGLQVVKVGLVESA